MRKKVHKLAGQSQMKHSSYELSQMQSLTLEMKITMTKQRIKQWHDSWGGAVYVSFSGGKDSTVLKHIVDSIYDDVPAIFINTGLEYPEIQQFVRKIKNGTHDYFNKNVEILYPELKFNEVISQYGYPVISKEIAYKIFAYISAKKHGKESYVVRQFNGTYVSKNGKTCYDITKWRPLLDCPYLISHKCCDIMKKNPAKKYEKETGRKLIAGTMASESQIRKQKWMKLGCNSFDSKRPESNPMSFWTENDVLEYIKKYNVPYASVYGEIVETGRMVERVNGKVPELKTTGCSRTGCMFCMFGAHIKRDDRFVRMKETHPNQYNYCMKSVEQGGLGLKDVIDWLNENVNTNIRY